MLFLLWHGARDMGDAARFDAKAKARFGRIVVAALVMGVALWGLDAALTPMTTGRGISKAVGLILLCVGGALVYAAAAVGLGAFSIAELKSAFRRQR